MSDSVSKTREIAGRATQHGADRFRAGFTIGQVVRDYGAVCQAVTELAVEREAQIDAADFQTLNRCLDDAIASAVSEYSRRQQLLQGEALALDHSLMQRNLIETALNGFELIMAGKLGVSGETGALVHRCLATLRANHTLN